MAEAKLNAITEYARERYEKLRRQYTVEEKYYVNQNIKRGLRNADGSGVMAGVTKIGSVQGYYIDDGERVAQEGKLYYRGIDAIEMLHSHLENGTFGFEEAAYLLLFGELPTQEEYEEFKLALASCRALPTGFFEDMILKAPSINVMNKLSRSVLALYSYDDNPDDLSVENLLRQSIELIARFPTIVADAYAVKCHHYDGHSLYIHNPKEGLSVAENFLRLVRHHKTYTEKEAKLLDALLILQAEHGGGNNSAFVCRAVSSSMSDTYSAISAAVGALKGPLHGGANAKVREMLDFMRESISDINDDEEVAAYFDKLLDKKAGDLSGKIYGIGHAVYSLSDPRAVELKKLAREMAEECGKTDEFTLTECVERIGIPKLMAHKNMTFPICANVDLYSGLVYSLLGIPEPLYTPLFAVARIAGWCAHRIEEVVSGGRIMRPAYRSAMIKKDYTPIEKR